MYQPLDCDLHDFLEIACLYRYLVKVELVDGGGFEARALTTHTSAEKEEFFVLEVEDGPCSVRMDRLLAITPLEPGARFGRVELAGKVCAVPFGL
ncbi:transcriptional antiterminator [Pseudomonas taiwanensis]|uniref:Rho-binding antiterminator n=1 Tax=Pseudomonas taiwanensis TaxID=470150 RepID=UPI0015B84903|nr:Rho-binding antiterminator [Pseudomonas taiwanensis]NWL77441.1 transcriptional antiterminator [Pseudomonas taiwanensis]